MRHKLWALVLLSLSLIAILFGWAVLQRPDLLALCPAGQPHNCLSELWRYGIAKPLFWGTRWLPVLFLVLLFVKREAFVFWAKSTWWIALVGLVLIFLAPYQFTGYMPDRTRVTEVVVDVYVLVSFALVAFKYWRLRGSK